MADDEITKQPGSITKTADNSQERISQVSNVNSAISQMQRKVDRQLDEAEANFGDIEGIEKVQSSFSKVLNEFSNTVSSIGGGFAKIAGDTARAGSDTIKQYGRAISQDISFNKQNIISLALSRTTPLFGYFAGKFMETDVFKTAKEKMKENLSNALGGVTAKLKEGWSKLFKRNKGDQERPVKNVAKIAEKVPKMAKGGYVEKSGLVNIHAGEIVAPIEKILARIDESINITRDLANISRKAQLNTLAKMGTFVATNERQAKVGLAKGFLRALTQVNTQYQEPAQQRMLRAVLSIQDSMGATIGTWPQVWQKMLVNHPTFRNIMFTLKGLHSVLGVPAKLVYSIFKSRGGYTGHLSRAKNPMQAAAENIGLVYSEGMWRLDNIARFTKATAEATRDMSSAITGKKYEPLEGIPRGIWSIFGITRSLTNWVGKHGVNLIGRFFGGKKFAKQLTDVMTKHRELPFNFKSSHEKALEELYDDRGAGELKRKKIKDKDNQYKDSGKIDYDILVSDYLKPRVKTEKRLIKLISGISTDVEENTEANKESNARSKREKIWGWIKSVFGIFGSGGFFGLLSVVGGFFAKRIVGFLGGRVFSGLIRGLGGSIFGSALSSMFGPKSLLVTGIKSLAASFAASKIGSALISGLKNPAVWSVASKAVGVAAAAGIGWQVGKQLDSWLGISEKFQATMNKWGAEARKLSDEMTAHQVNLSKSAREGGEQGYKDRKTLSMESSLLRGSSSKEKLTAIGAFGRANINAVNTGQVEYLREHAGEYLRWDTDTIELMRKQWMNSPETTGTKFIGSDAVKYGKNREASFLRYLKRYATEMTEEQQEASYKEYQTSITGKEPQVEASLSNIAAQAKLKGIELRSMILDKEKREAAAKKVEDLAKSGTKAVVTSLSNTTSAITNIINNNSKTINAGVGGDGQQHIGWGRGAYSYTYATIRGDTDED